VAATPKQDDLDLDAVRALLKRLASEGRADDAIEMALGLVSALRTDNTSLRLQLMQAMRARFGRTSEKVSAEQLALFLDQIAEDLPEGTQADAEVPAPKNKPRGARSRHGKKPLPANLPRERYVVPVPDDARRCEECGGEKKTIGYVESEVIEFRPATFVVLVPAREKVACPNCQAHVSVADDDKLESGMRPGPGLLAEMIVGKWQDSLPIERQADRFKRLGVDLASSTLLDWAAFGVDMLAPIARRITQLVLLSSYIQADDTTLKVLDPEKKPAVKRGHIWAFVGMDARLTAFLYAPDWTATHPAELLASFGGHLQGDGYAGFEKMLAPPDDDGESVVSNERRLACGMHIRRRFENAARLGDARGAVALALFRKIYAVEAACRDEGLTHEQRFARRQSESLPIAHELYAWIEKLHATLVPSSKIYDATRYALNHKDAWLRCFSDGKFEIDNGEVERQLRRVSLGRKNYLFAGSDKGAVRAAIAYTVLACCRMHGVDPSAYLRDVLRKIADGWPQTRLDELLPDRWAPPAAG
jgi:transposase